MSVIRVAHGCQYTTIPTATIRDTRLSLQALGLLTRMISRPDGWVFRVVQLRKECQIGKDRFQALKRELVAAGYMTADHRVHGPGGQFRTEMVVYAASILPLPGGAVDPQPPVGDRDREDDLPAPEAKGGKTTTRPRVDGGTRPLDENAKTEMDEYIELGMKRGGSKGSPPTDPVAWARTVRSRIIAAGGLTPMDRTQLAAWRQREAQAAAQAAKALAVEEARAAADAAQAQAKEARQEARRLNAYYESLPPEARQRVDAEAEARYLARHQAPPGDLPIPGCYKHEILREQASAPPDPGAEDAEPVEAAPILSEEEVARLDLVYLALSDDDRQKIDAEAVARTTAKFPGWSISPDVVAIDRREVLRERTNEARERMLAESPPCS